jgi:hypothetical protein
MRRGNRWYAAFLALIVLTGCDPTPKHAAAPAVIDGGDIPMSVARQLLARFDGQLGGQPFVSRGDAITLSGPWEPAVAAEYARSLAGGMVVMDTTGESHPSTQVTVTWADGTSRAMFSLDPYAAVSLIRDFGLASDPCHTDSGCPDYLRLSDPKLVTGTIATSRGPATVPLWSYAVMGSKVRVQRLAIRLPDAPQPEPFSDAPGIIAIESAAVDPDGRTLHVAFLGGVCGTTTSAAVESEKAVVVVITSHEKAGEMCIRPLLLKVITVTLAAPLGDRVVLDARAGLPVVLRTG